MDKDNRWTLWLIAVAVMCGVVMLIAATEEPMAVECGCLGECNCSPCHCLTDAPAVKLHGGEWVRIPSGKAVTGQ